MSAPAGLVARFPDAQSLTAAAEAAAAAGYRRIDAFSPFPIPAASRAVGCRGWIVPVIAAVAGLIGAAIQYATQYGLNVLAYPIDVGGRPLHSWPAFLPATVIVAILWASAAALVGMLLLNGLPRLHHPVFAAPGFERASEDAFFLWIEAADPLFDRRATEASLRGWGASDVHDVAA